MSTRRGFAALADPTRVQLVELLARRREPMSVGQIVAAMDLAQSTVSQHLKILAAVRYAGVVEHSVYVEPAAHGRGVGTALLTALIASTEATSIWTAIFPENTASLRLHRKAGFRVVGMGERIGRHHGRWRDVLLIERRSQPEPADPDLTDA